MKKNRYLRIFGIIILVLVLALASAGCNSGSSDPDTPDPAGTGTAQDGAGSGNPGNVAGRDSSDPGNGSGGSGDNTGSISDGGASGGSDKCEITAFATGKADAILVSAGSVNVLIDAGEETDAELICRRLQEKGINRLDLMIVTHFDRDHAGGVLR